MKNEEDYVLELKNMLEKSLSKLKKEKVGLAFSGGIDSTILARLMKNLEIKFTAYVVGVKNSHDIKQARKVAHSLKINLKEIEVSKEDIERAVPVEYKILKELYEKNNSILLDPNPIPISFNLPLYFVAKNAEEKTIVVSQGPDEMFGGYKRHEKMSQEDSVKEMHNNIKNLEEFGIMQNLKNAEYFKKDFIFPYLEKGIVSFSYSLPYELKISNNIKKLILRKLAENLGIEKDIAYKEKKACQYGSGIIYVMKNLAKEKKVHISRYVRESIQ